MISYYRPAKALSDNIITHDVSPNMWLALYESYSPMAPELVTRYYHKGAVMTVVGDALPRTTVTKDVRRGKPHRGMELVSERVERAPDMGVRYRYDHTEQSILFDGGVIRMELIVQGLQSYNDLSWRLTDVGELARSDFVMSRTFTADPEEIQTIYEILRPHMGRRKVRLVRRQ